MSDTSAAATPSTSINRPGPVRVVALSMAGLAIAVGFGRFTYGLLLPAMTADLLGDYGTAGLLGTVNLVAYLIGLLAVSVVAGRVSAERLLAVGLAGSVAGIALLSVAPNFGMLAAAMALTGASAAGVWVPSIGVVSKAVPERHRGLALGFVTAGVGVAIVASGLIVTASRQVWEADAWRPVWAIEASLGAAVLVLILFLVRSLPASDGGGRRETAGSVFRLPGWSAIAGVYSAYALGFMLYVSYLVAALESDGGFSSGHASTIYSLWGLSSIFGGAIIGGVSDRVGRRSVLVIGTLLMAACSLLVLVGAEPWIALSALVFGILMSGLGAVVAAYVSDFLPPAAAVAAFGAITVPMVLVQALAPPLGGLLADRTGSFSATFLVSAAAFLVAALIAAMLHGRNHEPVEAKPPGWPTADGTTLEEPVV